MHLAPFASLVQIREYAGTEFAISDPSNDDVLREEVQKALGQAGRSGSYLEKTHIFVLAHAMRRPIVVYHYDSDQPRGSLISGIYLPDLWGELGHRDVCSRVPLCLVYTGTAIGRSNSLTMSFSATDVRGGLYYWTTSQGTGIMRVDFGAVEQVPEKFFPFTGNECYGCHALSPDGRKMSLSRRGIGNGQLGLINIVDGQETLGFTDNQREQFQSWNGTSTLFAGIFGDTNDLAVRHQLRIHDGDNGGVVERIDLDHEPGHPDWSPVEDRLNYTKVTHHSSSQRPGRGGCGPKQA